VAVRALIGSDIDGELSDDQLRELYAAPRTPWLRVNMVSSVDGAATGETGKSGSINNAPDHRVFNLLREICDAVVVGAGTLRTEGYVPLAKPLVIVTRSGEVPERLRSGEPGRVQMATCGSAERLEEARDILGAEYVHVFGEHHVDLKVMKAELASLGYTNLLSEGGPHLLRHLLAEGAADELTATFVPRLLAGPFMRIITGPPIDVPVHLAVLLEEDSTLLGRWFTHPTLWVTPTAVAPSS
jgi:riboflavin biosynthesis pyrimidine reductase